MRLELKKEALQVVSFDQEKFHQELEYSFKKLNRSERSDLKKWVMAEFGAKYPRIIERVFNKEARRLRLGI